MANSYYQTPTTPRLYVSYPLWQYANGGLDWYQGTYDGVYDTVPHEDLIKIIQLDPSDTVVFDWETSYGMYLFYGIVPSSHIEYRIPEKLWNFNYAMVLNHNLASTNVKPFLRQDPVGMNADNEQNISASNIINGPSAVPEYNGFSIFELTSGPHTYEYPLLRFGFWQPDHQPPLQTPTEIGTLMWGKYFDFPQNCDLNTTLSYEYGTSSVKSVGGKSINTTQWTKPDGWYNQGSGGTEPFGLRKPIDESIIDHDNLEIHDLHDTADSFRRKSGLRVWNISFDSLAPKYVMNQNPMMNSQGWDSNFDNYSVDADNITSTYNIDNGLDFYTDVVHKTNGGSIPMVMQIDKDDPSPQNFAIVKMSKYTITQKLPNLYSISLTLEEQV